MLLQAIQEYQRIGKKYNRSYTILFKVNDDLAESISLSHDLGHTPFGHAGEEVLSHCLKNSLATGNWGIKGGTSDKSGVSQVLNRLT